MKTSLLKMLAVVAVPSMLAVGCGGDDDKKPPVTTSKDMATKPTTGGDMAVSAGCTQIATFPSTKVAAFTEIGVGGLQYIDAVQGEEPNATDSSNVDILAYQYYAATGSPAPTTPHSYTFTSNDTFGQCTDCVIVNLNASSTDNGTFYFAQSGTVNVTSFAKGVAGATVAASGTNIHFVQWDYDNNNDQADASGACLDVASFSFSGAATLQTPDMGN